MEEGPLHRRLQTADRLASIFRVAVGEFGVLCSGVPVRLGGFGLSKVEVVRADRHSVGEA
jgi:hypothetical protein